MTRKHFEALAAALKDSKPEPTQYCHHTSPPGPQLEQWRADVRAIAAVCIAHNPRFDTRFFEACGYELSGQNV